MARVTPQGRLVRVVGAAAAIIGAAIPAVLASARAASAGQDGIPALGRAAFPGALVAAVFGTGPGQGLAEFSPANGRLVRWLVRSSQSPVPAAVSPDGQRVYFYYQDAVPNCPRNGFTEPALWWVPARGGRAKRAGVRTTAITFSPDGQMEAFSSTSRCGRVIRIVVRNLRTGARRRIIVWRNTVTTREPVFTPQLSWAPDDRHLAVSVSPAPAISSVAVVNALRATDVIQARPIAPCVGLSNVCLDPGFDIRGRLTFLKWRNELNPGPEWVMRLHRDRAVRLFRLSSDQSGYFTASIAVDRQGNAVLIQGGRQVPEIWRWSGGRSQLLIRSTRQMVVILPLWL